MKILIADDEKDIVEILKGRLIKKGHYIDIALDGERALEFIKTNKYDLAFVDHNMPEITGLELIKYIKQNKISTKTVMLTGYAEIEDFAAKQVGADEYITKPVSLKDIENIVNKYKKTKERTV